MLMTKFLKGVRAAFGCFFGLVVFWAAIESASGYHLGPAPARIALFYVIAGLSLAAGIVFARRADRPPDPETTSPARRVMEDMLKAAQALNTAAPSAEVLARVSQERERARADAEAVDNLRAEMFAHSRDEEVASPLLAEADPGAAQPSAQGAERPAAEPSAAEQVLDAASRACVALRHVFPPRFPPRTLNCLGGLPIAPAGFEYPTLRGPDGTPVGYSFMAQIDLATIPAGWSRAALPAHGHLYFFTPPAACWDGQYFQDCVRFLPEHADAGWAPRTVAAPTVLSPFDEVEYTHPWLKWRGGIASFDDLDGTDLRLKARERPNGIFPQTSPRVEIEVGWVEQEPTPREGHARASLLDFHGPALPEDPLLSSQGRSTDRLWFPFDGFPTNRHAAEILLGYVKGAVAERVLAFRKTLWGPAPPADAEKTRLTEELALSETFLFFLCTLRFSEPAEHEREMPLTGDERGQVLRVLETVRQGQVSLSVERKGWPPRDPAHLLNGWIAQAAALSAETALRSAEAAAQIPRRYVDALRWRHTPLKDHLFQKGFYTQHQMFGRGRYIQTAVEQWSGTHVLLMQFSPDMGTDWRLGDNGALQYWITPADLATQRFDRAVLTFEGH
jgi:hypothetical protein